MDNHLCKRMRPAELTAVTKYECLKALCVGVVVVLVIRLFFFFFEFSQWRANNPDLDGP